MPLSPPVGRRRLSRVVGPMIRIALPLAGITLLFSVCALVCVAVIGLTIPLWALFSLQALVMLSIALPIRAVRKRSVQVIARSVPGRATVLLSIAAVIGAAFFATNLTRGTPALSPMGESVHSFSANEVSGECRVSYNDAHSVVEPMTVCRRFEHIVLLAFAGAWLLFSSMALWLALGVFQSEEVLPHGG